MNAQIDLIEGTTRDLGKSQWFTPPELAQRVVEWAGVKPPNITPFGLHYPGYKPLRVLEPSAGNGALVRPLVAAGAEVDAVELDTRYVPELYDALLGVANADDIGPVIADFLSMMPRMDYDLCVMNPPYEDGKDVAFILHALKFAPRVVGIFTDRILFGVERKEGLWSKVRPTRIAFQSRRPFKGAQTDYVVLELIQGGIGATFAPFTCTIEWW